MCVARMKSLEKWRVSTQDKSMLCASRQTANTWLREIILDLSLQGRHLSMVFLFVLLSVGSPTQNLVLGENLADDLLLHSL